MSEVMDAHPNADLIDALHEVAGWLEQHPELPRAEYTTAYFRIAHDGRTDARRTDARRTLTTLARALGHRAIENEYSGEVSIRGEFGPVTVRAAAKVRDLVDAPPEPTSYTPILPVRDENGWELAPHGEPDRDEDRPF